MSVGSPAAALLHSCAERLANTDPFVSACFLLNLLPLSPLSASRTLLHSSQPRYLRKALTKLSYYSKRDLQGSTVISSSFIQFNSLVKAMINQLFTLPLSLH